MNTTAKVQVARSLAFFLTLAAAEVLNGLLGFPLSVIVVFILVFLVDIGGALAGFAFGFGFGWTRIGLSEKYGQEVAAFNAQYMKDHPELFPAVDENEDVGT